jgi:MHS family alpha-ketoglutarate permease-like MFS transporter
MFIALIMGSLLATIVALVLNAMLPAGAIESYAWRVPFLLGALLGIYAIFLRKGLEEPEAFKIAATNNDDVRQSTWGSIYENRYAVFTVIGLTAGPTVSYNTWVSGATSYSINFKHMEANGALWALFIACVVYIVVQPFWGMLSDRIGRKPNLFIGAGLGMLLAYPMINLIQGMFWQLAVAMSVSMFVLAAWTSIAPAVYAELFPTRIRATGTAIPYSFAVALFGGTAPYLQNWLASLDRMDIFSGYLALLNLLTVVTILFMPETRGRPLT